MKNKECPRCHRQCLQEQKVQNSISHVGNKIYICSNCGIQQGFVVMGYSKDTVEIEMEKRFRRELGV